MCATTIQDTTPPAPPRPHYNVLFLTWMPSSSTLSLSHPVRPIYPNQSTIDVCVKKLEVLCRVVYVDSEGLSDRRSVRNTVLTLAPKMLIVTGGSRRDKAELVSHVRHQVEPVAAGRRGRGGGRGGGGGGGDSGGSDDDGEEEEEDVACRFVVVNKAMEPLPVALDSGAFDVLLHDSLHTQLKWKQVRFCPSAVSVSCACFFLFRVRQRTTPPYDLRLFVML